MNYLLKGLTLALVIFIAACNKNDDPLGTGGNGGNNGGSTNDSANCISGVSNDLSTFPASLHPIFYPSGFWAGTWNDADAGSTGSVNFENADSCYTNSYTKIKYEVGANGFFGGSWLNANDWNAKISVPTGATMTKFSAKASTGFKFRWTCWPTTADGGVNVQDSLVGDNQWHDYTTTYTANPQDTVSIPMNFEGWVGTSGATAGDTLYIEIRNLRIE